MSILRLILLGSSILFISSISMSFPDEHRPSTIPVAVPVNDLDYNIPVVDAVPIGDNDIPVAHAIPVVEERPEPSAPPMEREYFHREAIKSGGDERAALEEKRRAEKEDHDREESLQSVKLLGLTGGARNFERNFNKMLLRFDEVLKQDGIGGIDNKDSHMNVGDYAMSIGKAYFFNNHGSLLADITKNTEIRQVEKAVSSFKKQFDSFDKILLQYRGENEGDIEAIVRSAKEYYVDHKPSSLNLGMAASIVTLPSDTGQAVNRAEIDALEHKLDDLNVRLKAINIALGKQYLKSVHDGDLDKVNLHLKLGADPYVRNSSGQNALELAWNNPEMFKSVINIGEKQMVNSKFSDDKFPLDHAIDTKSVDKVSVLMDNGAKNVEGFSTASSLHKAVKSGSSDIVKVMLDHDANPNTKYIDTKDMSYFQAMYLHTISRMAHFFGYSKDGETPLHTVTDQAISKVKRGESAEEELVIMKLLKEKGADIDHHKYYGKSVRQEVERLCSGHAHSEFCTKAKSILGM